MAKRYQSEFERGYDYVWKHYRKLPSQMLLELSAALRLISGDDAELARGMATGADDLIQLNTAKLSRAIERSRHCSTLKTLRLI